MPYIGKPQSSDPITVNASNIEDGSIIAADISSSLGVAISGSFTTVSSSFSTRVSDVEAGSTSKTLVSSSAQIADDISGSLSNTAIANLEAGIVSGSSQLATDISGSFGNQRVGTSDSPTFAGGTITGDFAVGGTLTAQEVHTEFESASILFTSGSTQFGNSSDDVHDFLGNTISGSATSTGSFGSVVVPGDVDIDGDLDVDGTTNLDNTDIDGTLTVDGGNIVFNEDSADQDFRVESNGNANMFLVDGGNNRIGIGTSAPPYLLTVKSGGEGSIANSGIVLENNDDTNIAAAIFEENTNPTAGILRLYAGGAEPVQLHAGGTSYVSSSAIAGRTNFGVGGTAAVFGDAGRGNVEINGTGTATLGMTIGGSAKGLLFHDGTDSYFRNYANGYFAIYTNNSEQMRITNDGLIGIGTTAPDTNCFLHLEDSSLDVKLRIEATASNRAALLSLVGGASDKSAIDFGVTGGTLDAARIRYDSSDGKLHIINGDHSYPEITVTTTAVGIDTASPQRAFVISDQGAGGIEFGPGATTNIMSNFNRGTSSYATLQIESSAVKIYTGTSSDKLLNIDSSGNISGSGEIKNQDGTKIYTNERFGKIKGADGTTTSGAENTPHTETIDMPEGSHILTATMGRTEVHIGAVYLIIVPPHGSNVINCSVTQLGYGSYASTSLIQVQNQNNGSAFAFNSNSDGIIKVIYTNDDSNNWQYWSWSYTTLGVVRT